MFFVSTGHIESGRPFAYDWLVRMLCTAPDARLDAPELGLSMPLPDGLRERRALAVRWVGQAEEHLRAGRVAAARDAIVAAQSLDARAPGLAGIAEQVAAAEAAR